MDASVDYVGTELELFAGATNWKDYWASRVMRYISGDVLEVGAGLGSNTTLLARAPHDRWLCLEPDARLAASIPSASRRDTFVGRLDDFDGARTFDTILYIDVLEHIEADSEEAERCAQRLNPGGHLIVLSPAHMFLFSPFDASIGHFRRYTRASLHAVIPTALAKVELAYLDSLGLFASLANRLVLKQSMPNAGQIELWDKRIVPLSRRLDPLLGYGFGKSVLGVYRR